MKFEKVDTSMNEANITAREKIQDKRERPAEESPAAGQNAEAETRTFAQRSYDFFLLSKPLIVLLLLFTTFAGMVAGFEGFPPAAIIFWTMVGGAFSAGGASAINQYIDRNNDRVMQRTARRPIPAGKVKPLEGLIFGIGICAAGLIVLGSLVNLLSAALSLAGMIYYVGVYSLWLKPRTVQNIVIGGGAGAIPTLVGWAAATGRLEWQALGLFMIIFLWTPPHFWALALVRRKDYARVGIPMLPVVYGEAYTRRQIFLYTLVLVAFSLSMPFMDLGSYIYLFGAIVFGGLLVYFAYRVRFGLGNAAGWALYRFSSIYLALIFLGLIMDVWLGNPPIF
jgi:protoheme IX farnesyltransferase